MKLVAIVFLTFLLAFCVHGQHSKGSKCKCLNGYIGKVIPKHIKSGPVIHDPSIFCPQTEIIITTTADKEKCVNPESLFGKLILETKNKHERKEAVSTTTTTASSTSLHTTSRLSDSALHQRGQT
ncbi:C-X-C motif chemokine 11-1-like [Sparus aurata]|uniref:C-X-C motif chemokine 11-1-like n=1 Tax=Sparus aurata TaxID=8175 RepID=A0A671VKL1_SPAAU|nr:C-X-C motif chemokine 11-1-like [Sparus aurata]